MPVLSASDAATFRRPVLVRALVKTIGDRRDDAERLAKECGGELGDGLREIADAITDWLENACIETLIEREVADTDEDRRDREIEARDRRILSSPQASGR